MKVSFGIYKKYWAREAPEGGHPPSTRAGARPQPRGPPGSPLMPIFGYMESFVEEKTTSKLSGRDSAATRWNQSRAPVELFSRGNIPPGRGNHYHRHHHGSYHWEGAISINIFTSTISSQTLVHLLYPIIVSKSGIGTCRLLVVLITPCS